MRPWKLFCSERIWNYYGFRVSEPFSQLAVVAQINKEVLIVDDTNWWLCSPRNYSFLSTAFRQVLVFHHLWGWDGVLLVPWFYTSNWVHLLYFHDQVKTPLLCISLQLPQAFLHWITIRDSSKFQCLNNSSRIVARPYLLKKLFAVIQLFPWSKNLHSLLCPCLVTDQLFCTYFALVLVRLVLVCCLLSY